MNTVLGARLGNPLAALTGAPTAGVALFERCPPVHRVGVSACMGSSDSKTLNPEVTMPAKMGDALPSVPLGSGRTAMALNSGDEYSCASLDNGSQLLGKNTQGVLGLRFSQLAQGEFSGVSFEPHRTLGEDLLQAPSFPSKPGSDGGTMKKIRLSTVCMVIALGGCVEADLEPESSASAEACGAGEENECSSVMELTQGLDSSWEGDGPGSPPVATLLADPHCYVTGFGMNLTKLGPLGAITALSMLEIGQACPPPGVPGGPLNFGAPHKKVGSTSKSSQVYCAAPPGHVIWDVGVSVAGGGVSVLALRSKPYLDAKGMMNETRPDYITACYPDGRVAARSTWPTNMRHAGIANWFGTPAGYARENFAVTGLSVGVAGDLSHLGAALSDLPWAQPYLVFSEAGPIAGLSCTSLNEAADAAGSWGDNYLCARDRPFTWSSAGAIAGMNCTQIYEAAEPAYTTWMDNFLCQPTNSILKLQWSSAGPIPGMACTNFYEHADPYTWDDNFLCYSY